MVKQEKGTGETQGQRLKRLRRAKGLTLEQVYQETKIRTGILEALEEDAVAQMAPAYVKGLLKIYCIFLGDDSRDVTIAATRGEPVNKESGGVCDTDKHSSLAETRINASSVKKQLKIEPIILIIGLLILGVVAFKIGRSISIRRVPHVKEPSAQADISGLKASSPMPVINTPRLGIRAKEDCWLEVRIDGRTIFKNILQKSQFEYWEAKKKIEFSLGNAGGVDVEVNGKLFSTLGRRGQVIKNITITKEGLSVPK